MKSFNGKYCFGSFMVLLHFPIDHSIGKFILKPRRAFIPGRMLSLAPITVRILFSFLPSVYVFTTFSPEPNLEPSLRVCTSYCVHKQRLLPGSWSDVFSCSSSCCLTFPVSSIGFKMRNYSHCLVSFQTLQLIFLSHSTHTHEHEHMTVNEGYFLIFKSSFLDSYRDKPANLGFTEMHFMVITQTQNNFLALFVSQFLKKN